MRLAWLVPWERTRKMSAKRAVGIATLEKQLQPQHRRRQLHVVSQTTKWQSEKLQVYRGVSELEMSTQEKDKISLKCPHLCCCHVQCAVLVMEQASARSARPARTSHRPENPTARPAPLTKPPTERVRPPPVTVVSSRA